VVILIETRNKIVLYGYIQENLMLGSKGLDAWNCQNSLSSAGNVVALRIDKDAL